MWVNFGLPKRLRQNSATGHDPQVLLSVHAQWRHYLYDNYLTGGD